MISLSHAAACSGARYGARFGGAGQSTQRPASPESPAYQDLEAGNDTYRIEIDSHEDSGDEELLEDGPDTEPIQEDEGPSWKRILKAVFLGFLAISGAGLAGATVVKAAPHFRGDTTLVPNTILPPPIPQPIPYMPPINSTALALMPNPIPLPIAHPDALPYPPPALRSQWPSSVELLASSSQNHYSYFSDRGSDYTNSLVESVGRNGTNSLGQSHADMRERGYPIRSGRQHPVSSADVSNGWCMNVWDKRDTHKQRFALLLDGGREFRRDCNKWRNMLHEEYNVPRQNILYYRNSVSKDVTKGIQQIRQWIQEENLAPEDVEVMVYYSGHGRAFYEDIPRPLRDGEAAGAIALKDGRYKEEALRDTLKDNLPDIPTTVILDACQSGAWIA